MAHGDLAQIAALLGAVGSVLVLVPRSRLGLAVGLGVLGAAEAALLVALVPRSDLERLNSSRWLALLAVAVLAWVGLVVVFVRWPVLVPVALALAAPFRIPVDLGSQHAFLLLPLYGVLAAACGALLVRAARGPLVPVPRLLSLPVAAF